jgi:excisionase family DNA binding protein
MEHKRAATSVGYQIRQSPEPLTYSPQAAAQVTSLSLRRITTAIATGELRSVKRGRRRLIFREDLERFLRGD